MRKEVESFTETEGIWEPVTGRIIIKRDRLESVEKYAGILLHETSHAISGASDVSRNFENHLTKLLGIIASKALRDFQ